jgi:AmmeMemoRadiSam system protein B
MGEQMWYLRDPLELTEYQLVMPPALAQILLFIDGTRTVSEIHQALCQYLGIDLDYNIVVDTIAQLDKACLLDNENAQQALAQSRQAYRDQPFRPAALADLSYPKSKTRLTRQLDSYGADDDLANWQPWYGRGLISPHIDYPRGGPVYARVWQRAKEAVLNADVVIIFGTDHNGGRGTITLTEQDFATPYGILPTDKATVQAIAQAIGPENAFAEELHHRKEHSIELSAVWLHYLYDQAGVEPKPIIPILCGSFRHFLHNGAHPATDPLLTTAIETLQKQTADKRVLAVASVDFAHMGPAFNDSFPMDEARRAALRQSDQQLVQSIIRGDAASFYDQIAAAQDQNRICGFSPIYLMLRYLGSTEGVQVAYQHCPADDENESLVSIAGVLLE